MPDIVGTAGSGRIALLLLLSGLVVGAATYALFSLIKRKPPLQKSAEFVLPLMQGALFAVLNYHLNEGQLKLYSLVFFAVGVAAGTRLLMNIIAKSKNIYLQEKATRFPLRKPKDSPPR